MNKIMNNNDQLLTSFTLLLLFAFVLMIKNKLLEALLYYVLMCDFHVIESLHYFDKLIIINDYTKQLHHYITPLIFQNNAIVELDV